MLMVDHSDSLVLIVLRIVLRTVPCRISRETDPRSILEIKPLEPIVGAVSNA